MNSPAPTPPPTFTTIRPKIDAPLRLFLHSHRPLAFVGGQALLTLSPLLALLGWRNGERWAEQLSTPDGIDQLDAWLGEDDESV